MEDKSIFVYAAFVKVAESMIASPETHKEPFYFKYKYPLTYMCVICQFDSEKAL